jgi:hypothetical protein
MPHSSTVEEWNTVFLANIAKSNRHDMVEDLSISPSNDAITMDNEGVSKSALRDNILRKGKNAYYYAHAHRATGPEVGEGML